MAYLGIANHEKFNGLYYFSSLAMRDEIGKNFNGAMFFYDKEKKQALEKMSISVEDIQDGRIIIDYFKNKDENAYLGLTGTPFDGVYVFKRKVVRDREAKHFSQVYMTMNKDEILQKFSIGESEIRDGGFLMSEEVKNWLKKKPTTKTVEKSVEVVEVKKAVSTNLLENMLNSVSKTKNIVEITMITGEKYRIAMKPIFYLSHENVSFANMAVADSSGNVALKENMVDDLVNNKDICVVNKSQITYGEGFAVIRNCDDEYSPTVHHNDNTINISHFIKEIVINVNQVVSVIGMDEYSEINLAQLTKGKNKLIYEYLYKKYN